MAKVFELSSKGPNGEPPNVRARAVFYEGDSFNISAYLERRHRHTFCWRTNVSQTTLTGFELSGPSFIVVREIWIGLDQVLKAPTKLGDLAPKGSVDIRGPVDVFQDVRLEFGA